MKRLFVVVLFLILAMATSATVTNQVTSVTFTCTGSTGPYGFTFPVSDSSSLTVTQDGVVLLTSKYTVTPVNNNYVNGGSVTLNTACPLSSTLILARNTPLTQTTVYTDNMPIPMKTFERSLDKLTEITQELFGTYAATPGSASLSGNNTFTGTNTFKSVNGGNPIFSRQFATLQDALNAAAGATLVIDQPYSVASITIPRLTTIRCMGPQSGTVSFTNTSGSNITLTAGGSQSDYIRINGCNFLGAGGATTARGIDATNAGIIYLEDVTVRFFYDGIYGNFTDSLFCDNCIVAGNKHNNYELTNQSNSWRIRDGISSQATQYGLHVDSTSNNNVISGVRMESNIVDAIYNEGDTTTVRDNRFEANNNVNAASATNLTLSGNYYSGASWTDSGTGTKCLDATSNCNLFKIDLGISSSIYHGEIWANNTAANLNSVCLMANNTANSDLSTFVYTNAAYGSWLYCLGSNTSDASSVVVWKYRNAGAANGAGTQVASISNTGVITAGGISTSGTQTAGQAICWKTATTLGSCSTVVGAGGACTCN